MQMCVAFCWLKINKLHSYIRSCSCFTRIYIYKYNIDSVSHAQLETFLHGEKQKMKEKKNEIEWERAKEIVNQIPYEV